MIFRAEKDIFTNTSDRDWVTNDNYHLFCNKNGEVMSFSGHVYKPNMSSGYPVVIYTDIVTGKCRGVVIARIIADTFLEKPKKNAVADIFLGKSERENKLVVIHLDGDVTNNKVKNLAYGNRSAAKAFGWSKRDERGYKERTGSIFYAYMTPGYDTVPKHKFTAYKDMILAGFNTGRVYHACKYHKRYKGLYWRRIDQICGVRIKTQILDEISEKK